MTNPAGRNPRGREDRLARLTPEQRAAFEARAIIIISIINLILF